MRIKAHQRNNSVHEGNQQKKLLSTYINNLPVCYVICDLLHKDRHALIRENISNPDIINYKIMNSKTINNSVVIQSLH